MTGTQTMIERILADAEDEAGRILRQAENEADERLRQARMEADRELARWETETAARCETVLRQARSQAKLMVRDARLLRRRHWIDETLKLTLTRLYGLPDKEYIAFLETLLEKNALPGEGILRLNARDLNREGIAALNRELTGGRRITLSDQPIELDGGFLLQYDEIEMNCGFSAMLEEKREELEDLLNQVLFS